MNMKRLAGRNVRETNVVAVQKSLMRRRHAMRKQRMPQGRAPGLADVEHV
jgi:hypothetical protein